MWERDAFTTILKGMVSETYGHNAWNAAKLGKGWRERERREDGGRGEKGEGVGEEEVFVKFINEENNTNYHWIFVKFYLDPNPIQPILKNPPVINSTASPHCMWLLSDDRWKY